MTIGQSEFMEEQKQKKNIRKLHQMIKIAKQLRQTRVCLFICVSLKCGKVFQFQINRISN